MIRLTLGVCFYPLNKTHPEVRHPALVEEYCIHKQSCGKRMHKLWRIRFADESKYHITTPALLQGRRYPVSDQEGCVKKFMEAAKAHYLSVGRSEEEHQSIGRSEEDEQVSGEDEAQGEEQDDVSGEDEAQGEEQ